jgi:hypothetical protein
MDYEDYMNIINRVRDGGLSHLYVIIQNTKKSKTFNRDQYDKKQKNSLFSYHTFVYISNSSFVDLLR